MSQIIIPQTGGSSGTWADWSPTLTGFSSDPGTSIYRYWKLGTLVIAMFRQNVDGISNSTAFTISLPVAASSLANMVWVGIGTGRDNTAPLGNYVSITILASGTTMSLGTTPGGGLWTASGGKRATGMIIYESDS